MRSVIGTESLDPTETAYREEKSPNGGVGFQLRMSGLQCTSGRADHAR
jgi:hypothetical protein